MSNFNELRSAATLADADAVVAIIDCDCIDDMNEHDVDTAVLWLDELVATRPASKPAKQAAKLLERITA